MGRYSFSQIIRPLVLLGVAAMGILLAGCSWQAFQEDVRLDISGAPTYYKDQWARRGKPLVHVQPAEVSDAKLTALFVPFRVTQKISDPDLIGYTEARIVWQTWLEREVFSVIEFNGDHGPFRRDTALQLARARGADVLIGGFVTYYYNGGSASDSQVAIQVEIYDTQSGQMIWSIGHSALMPASVTNDYIVFTTKTRMPSDPMFVLTRAIADDMSGILGRWMPATGEEPGGVTGGNNDADGVKRAIGRPTF